MSSEMSVARVLAKLEARAAVHREQQAFHAQKEAHHREQREKHEAELTKVNANLETFRSAAAIIKMPDVCSTGRLRSRPGMPSPELCWCAISSSAAT